MPSVTSFFPEQPPGFLPQPFKHTLQVFTGFFPPKKSPESAGTVASSQPDKHQRLGQREAGGETPPPCPNPAPSVPRAGAQRGLHLAPTGTFLRASCHQRAFTPAIQPESPSPSTRLALVGSRRVYLKMRRSRPIPKSGQKDKAEVTNSGKSRNTRSSRPQPAPRHPPTTTTTLLHSLPPPRTTSWPKIAPSSGLRRSDRPLLATGKGSRRKPSPRGKRLPSARCAAGPACARAGSEGTQRWEQPPPAAGLAAGYGACLGRLEPIWAPRCCPEQGWPRKASPRSCSSTGCAEDGHGCSGKLQPQGLAGTQHPVLDISGATC